MLSHACQTKSQGLAARQSVWAHLGQSGLGQSDTQQTVCLFNLADFENIGEISVCHGNIEYHKKRNFRRNIGENIDFLVLD